jgi:replicative DNA helicase
MSQAEKPVLFFSLEMPSYEIAQRLIARRTGMTLDKMGRGDMSMQDYAEIQNTKKSIAEEFIIDDRAGLNIDQIYSACIEQSQITDLGLVVIDYLTIMRFSGGGTMTDQIGDVTKKCKELSKRLSCPVIVLSQLNRGVEHRDNKRPVLADLRSSGSIEQDADVVMFVYRDEYYLEKEDDVDPLALDQAKGKAEIIIAKNRQGRTGTAEIQFSGERMEFYEDDFAF